MFREWQFFLQVLQGYSICKDLWRNSCKDILDKLVECYPLSKEIMEKDFDASKKIVQKFCEVVKEFEKEYSALKIQMNKLDFNDLEKYIIKILNNKSIRENLQERYKYIFVDEYQDVNAVQEEIISLLTKDNFVFMVDKFADTDVLLTVWSNLGEIAEKVVSQKFMEL